MSPLLFICITLHFAVKISCEFARLSDYIDYDVLVANLTLLDDNKQNILARDLLVESPVAEEQFSEFHIWLVLSGVLIITVILSAIVIVGTILNNRNILRGKSDDFNTKVNA